MSQLFSSRATLILRTVLVGLPVIAAAAGCAAYAWSRSDSAWNVGVPAPQPIPFRHDLHAGTMRIDCRFCHAAVETSASAGMPSAQICMNCHGEVWVGASVLEPLRTALALDQPITWTSVSRLPDYAWFHHSAHVTAGVACETCHGRVDQMAQTVKARTLSMGWCLDCHRDPDAGRRPEGDVFAMGWQPKSGQDAPAMLFDHAAISLLTSCSTCHR